MPNPLLVLALIKVGADAISSVCGAVQSVKGLFKGKPSGGASSAEITGYLMEIDHKIDAVLLGQEAIIRRIDELPSVVAALVSEIVESSAINREYIYLAAYQSNYTHSSMLGELEVKSDGWARISASLFYVFEKEWRLTKTIQLVKWFDFADLVTGARAREIIVPLLENRLIRIERAKNEEIERCQLLLNTLSDVLMSECVSSNNLATIHDIKDISVTYSDDRYISEQYSECHREEIALENINATREITVCVKKTRSVLDGAFSQKKNAIRAQIDDLLRKMVSSIESINELEFYCNLLEFKISASPFSGTKYECSIEFPVANTTTEKASVGNIPFDNVVLFARKSREYIS